MVWLPCGTGHPDAAFCLLDEAAEVYFRNNKHEEYGSTRSKIMASSDALTKRVNRRSTHSNGERAALVTAPACTDTSVIRSILEAEGVKPFTVDELTEPASSLRDLVQQAINRADLVIAVLPRNAAQEDVFVE